MTDDLHHKTKILTGRPGRPKGVEIHGAKKADVKGTEILPGTPDKVKIIDKNAKTPNAPVEINVGDTGEE